MPVANKIKSADERCFLTERDLEWRWDKSPRTLQRWRAEGRGPRFHRIGRSIRYAMQDVREYEAARAEGGEQ